jgi:selenocysteine-specific elongation factor
LIYIHEKLFLAKALSFTGGTACFDKSPQSQARGITLDLGFSTFKLPTSGIQVTVVDCPGHASLIRTILCGAQIIDIIVLVIDAAKGIQVQTAECLVIAEIMAKRLVIVVNKVDLWSENERSSKFDAFARKLRLFLKNGPFSSSAILPFSTILEGHGDLLKSSIEQSLEQTPIQRYIIDACFVFAVDHCFQVKGQGTVLTGTVLQGQIGVNEV